MADVQITLGLPMLQKGANPQSGPTVVKHLQLMLNERGGFPVLVEDGNFGASTEKSVKHYQQNENLTVDGVVGSETLLDATIVRAHQHSAGARKKTASKRSGDLAAE
jgi:peptidoglycan hydrolase-like protein with peptidoglycan-binding domain